MIIQNDKETKYNTITLFLDKIYIIIKYKHISLNIFRSR